MAVNIKSHIRKISDKYKNLSEPVKASVWFTVCNVINKGIALLSTPIFTRILTEEQYGTFSIFQSWCGIFIIFTSLNMFLGGYTKGLILYKEDREGFTSSLLAFTTVITFLYGIIYLVNIRFWTDVFQMSPILMIAMFAQLLFIPALDFWAAGERFDYKYKKYVLITIITTLTSVVGGMAAVLNSPHKLEARVYTDTFAKIFFAVFIYILIFWKGKKIVSKKYWIYSLKFNIPLMPHYLSNYVLNQSDRLMIGRMIGNTQAAYYSVAYTISTMMNLIVNAINNSLTPYIFKAIDGKTHKNIKAATKPIFMLVAGLSIVTMIFAPEIIRIFAGTNYAEAIYIVPPVSASVFFYFLYTMFSSVEYFYEMTGWIALATCISAGTNLVLNYIFISLFGYFAAGYTTLFCYILLAFMHYLFYKKVLREQLPDVEDLYDMKAIFFTSCMVVLIMLVMVLTYKQTYIRYLIALLMLIVMVKYRKVLYEIVNRKGLKG